MRFAIVDTDGGLTANTILAALNALPLPGVVAGLQDLSAVEPASILHRDNSRTTSQQRWLTEAVGALHEARGEDIPVTDQTSMVTLISALMARDVDAIVLGPLALPLGTGLAGRPANQQNDATVLSLAHRFSLPVVLPDSPDPLPHVDDAVLAVLAVRHQQAVGNVSVLAFHSSSDMVGATRITIAESAGAGATPAGNEERLLLLATNIDDMNPQHYDILNDRLFAAGALDVWLESLAMKKGRPGSKICILARPVDRDGLIDLLIEQSTTLGVRVTSVERISAARRFETVATRWGDIRIKLKIWRGRVLDAVPEYDDCAAIARREDIGIRAVTAEAVYLAQVYIGRRVTESREVRLLGVGES